ncbi:MAG: kynureninase [Thermoplasmata archaeon]
MKDFKPTKEFAKKLDEEDPLKNYRDRFKISKDSIYMDGNSLGLLSEDSKETLGRVVKEWKELGIKGWEEGDIPWFWYGEKLGNMTAPLIGAEEEEVVITNSTTVNIHNLIGTFYEPDKRGKKIIVDELDFPTDHYALKGEMRKKGIHTEDNLIVIESEDGRTIDEDKVVEAMDDDVSIVFLPSVLFRSGQRLDMKYITEEAHKRNLLVGFDIAHSIGVIPHEFDKWRVDFAVWCSYKYLNGGPGAVGGLYVNQRHFYRTPSLSRWWGHEKSSQFEMNLDFTPADNAGAWQIGTINVLSATPIEGSLKMLQEVGIENVRKKSLWLNSYLINLVDELVTEKPYNFGIGTPSEKEDRGGHVAVTREKDAYRINLALRDNEVIVDFRPPNVIRICPSPLYVRYVDVWNVVNKLKGIIDKKEYENFEKNTEGVT